MFPLNAVIFPGVSVPLNVFEDRYRALVHHLLRVEDPTQRLFGSVGIREGYEVGDHGSQSLFRVGCRVQLTEVESHSDGTFSIVAVGLDRIQLERLDTTGVAWQYERPFRGGDGRVVYPDFTIEDADTGSTYLWEHLGMLADPAYRRRWEQKQAWNATQGVSTDGGPIGTLIVTSDDARGGFDAAAIKQLVEERFG